MKKPLSALLLLLGCSVVFSGCSLDNDYSDEDLDIVASYVANAVLAQSKGFSYRLETIIDEEPQEEPTVQPTKEPAKQDKKDDLSKDNTVLLEEHLQIGNFGGFPSITIPNGFVSNLPVGINITGNCYEDEKVLNIAYALESAMDYKGQVVKEVK